MKTVSNETLATIDKIVIEKYPTARKIDSELLQDRDFDGFYPVAHYVIYEMPGADEFGFDGEFEEENDLEYEIVAISVCVHDETDRIFMWEMNNHGEPNCVYGESDGEIVGDKLVFEVGLEQELY